MVLVEELDHVHVLLGGHGVPDRQESLEVAVPGPDEVVPQVGPLMELMRGGHRLEVDPVHLAPAPQGEVVPQLVDVLECDGLILPPRLLVKVLMVEQRPVCLGPRTRLHDPAPQVSLAIAH